ncbi:MAG: bleomycin resistance family protein [Flavobacteriaceae bacterium]
MKYQPIVPMIWTSKLNETIDFYVQNLNFICGEFNDEWGWATLHNNDCELMIAKPNEHTSFDKPIFTGSFYIRVDDVDYLWNEIKDKVKVCYPLEIFDWGMKEFAIYDNNDYLIQFGQNIENE